MVGEGLEGEDGSEAQSSLYLHNLGCGGIGENHLGMLSTVVSLQLSLGGEEFPTELAGQDALCLLEVLAGDVILQSPWEAEGS